MNQSVSNIQTNDRCDCGYKFPAVGYFCSSLRAEHLTIYLICPECGRTWSKGFFTMDKGCGNMEGK